MHCYSKCDGAKYRRSSSAVGVGHSKNARSRRAPSVVEDVGRRTGGEWRPITGQGHSAGDGRRREGNLSAASLSTHHRNYHRHVMSRRSLVCRWRWEQTRGGSMYRSYRDISAIISVDFFLFLLLARYVLNAAKEQYYEISVNSTLIAYCLYTTTYTCIVIFCYCFLYLYSFCTYSAI